MRYRWLVFGMMLSAGGGLAEEPSSWPGFRGRGDSRAVGERLPVEWAPRGGRGGWTVRLPGYGQSSPVVWGDRVFVTAVSGEQKETLHLLAKSLATGATFWERQFEGTQRVADSDSVSRGAPTPVVDSRCVYAMFESGDLLCCTLEGEEVWRRSIVADYGEFIGPHGYSSSPVLADGRVILQVCHGGPSYVLALDSQTGQTLWKTEHPSQTGWSTPVVVPGAQGSEVIVTTAGSVRGFSVADGQERWRVTGLAGNTTASPSTDGEIVVIGAGRRESSDAGASVAIRLGGSGDVTESHVLWRSPQASTGYASPLIADGLAYFVNRVGVATCVDVATGEPLWSERLPGECWASPIGFGEYVAFFCKGGDVAMYRRGRMADRVAESSLSATDIVYGVAAVEDAWLVRTGRGLIKVTGQPASTNASRPAESTREGQR